MNANDFRLGNKVEDSNGFIFDVVSIHSDGTVYCDFEGNEGDVWEFDNKNPCFGIQLTEEILLKCGFKEKKYGVYHVGDFSIRLHSYGYKKGMSYLNGISLYTYPMYLHQLQNLYWCLCGKELTINL